MFMGNKGIVLFFVLEELFRHRTTMKKLNEKKNLILCSPVENR